MLCVFVFIVKNLNRADNNVAYYEERTNKSYNTTIAVEKKRGGDKIYIYILGDNGEWMYLEYSKGNMFIATNNTELNAAVVLASEKNTDENFTLRLGSERMKENFLKRNDIEEE